MELRIRFMLFHWVSRLSFPYVAIFGESVSYAFLRLDAIGPRYSFEPLNSM